MGKKKKIVKTEGISKKDISEVLKEFYKVILRPKFVKIDKQFDRVDKKFVKVDRRFVQIDSRFDQVDRRFVQIDGRFDLNDIRFERIEKKLEEHDEKFEISLGILIKSIKGLKDLRPNITPFQQLISTPNQ